MKQSWKLRCVFVFMCIGIVLYLGLGSNKLLLNAGQDYKEYNLVINEVMINNRSSIRDEDGDFEGWIEIYNKGDKSENLLGFGLSNDSQQPFLWTLPSIILEPKSHCIVWTSAKNRNEINDQLHANFKLKDKDKVIILTAPNENWYDILLLVPMGENIAYGRAPDGGSQFFGFDAGTPNKANNNEILIEGPNTKRLDGPVFSQNGGFYTQAFDLSLTANATDAAIYYTLDGSVPTKESHRYTQPILIPSKTNEATVLRARVYKEGYPKSEIITHSYFAEPNIYNAYNTPVISLVTDPENLYDYEKGIYVTGKTFDRWIIANPNTKTNQMTPANYNQRGKDWEREASIELFEPNGVVGLAQDIGIRTQGGFSRASELKPLSLFARKDYDDREYFFYDFFNSKAKKSINDNESNRFSRILLRTSATDRKYSFFRDAFIQSLMENSVVLDTQSSKPCIVYLNGKYLGIHNIREAYDKNYIIKYYDINQEDVVIIKNPTGTAGTDIQEGYVGDEMHYNRLIDFVKENDLKMNSNYDFVSTQIDINNFIEYNILQIYCDNRDWPGNNVGMWRKRTQVYEPNAPYGQDGRWRWIVFDLDYGFGLYQGEKAAKNNSLERAIEQNGPEWPNPPWSTLLFRSLLKNDDFRNQFINVFADRLNTIFAQDIVVDRIEAMKEIYYPNVMNHILRWNLHDNKVENWLGEIEGMKSFAIERPNYIRQHILEHFGLSGTAAIRLEMSEGGSIKLNSLNIEQTNDAWEGIYFKDIPITIEAIPKPGYVFVGWEGVSTLKDRTIKINILQYSNLKAVFKSDKDN